MAKKNNKNKKKPPSAHDLFSMPACPCTTRERMCVCVWISSEISLASASTVRAHFGCIFKATTECAT